MATYYIINIDENGGVHIYKMTREQLESDLNCEEGDGYIDRRIISMKNLTNLNLDEECGSIIIKGEQIFPEPEKIVTEWKIK